MNQRIVSLTECPQYSDVCAAWAFGQWGSQRGGSLERTRQRFARVPNRAKTMSPCSYSMANAHWAWPACGQATIINEGMFPWLAGVFVHPDHRRQGIAQRLEEAIVQLARQRNHPVLHLITDKSEVLYAGWGWQTIERRRQYDGEVVVMEKKL